MHVKCLVQLLTFFGALTSSNGLKCGETCSSDTVSFPLGSNVLLPCILPNKQVTEATWSQNSSLVSIRPNGNVSFEDPRGGRVTVFPYLFTRGNFSILIHEIQPSDVGTYCCQLSQACHRVEVQLLRSRGEQFPWYYIVAGIGGFVLLLIACSLAFEYRGKRLIDSYYVNSPKNQNKNQDRTGHGNVVREDSDGHYEDMEGEMQPDDYENMHRGERDGGHEDTERDESEGDYVNAERGPHEGQFIEPGGQHGQTGHRTRAVVYENNEHDPQCAWRGPQSQSNDTQDQPRSTLPYYANQSEINNAATAGKKKKHRKRKKQPPAADYQFRNPIYGDSSVVSKT